MYFIFSPFQSPYNNAALEHYLLHRFNDEFLIFYINSPSVIIGKHQNAFAEANFKFIKKNNIPIVRRISGGGAVYHDEGNLNISIINNNPKINISSFLMPVIKFLNKVGIEAKQNIKNDIIVNNKKITGTAAHIFKSRTLQHGTLLIYSSLENLKEALLVERNKFICNSIASKPSLVTNLLTEINFRFSFDEIVSELKNFMCEYYGIENELRLNEYDIKNIEDIIKTKFSTWEWNYAYTKAFTYKDNIKNVSLECLVENGIIVSCNFSSDVYKGSYLIGKKFDMPFEELLVIESII